MNYKHKNVNELLRILVALGKCYAGESFSLTFFAGKGGVYRHVCKYDAEAGRYTSCEPIEGSGENMILCTIPARKVGTGILYVTKSVTIEDWQTADGKQQTSETAEVSVTIGGKPWGIEMTTSGTDQFQLSQMTLQLLPLITRGRPGSVRWSDMTAEEKRELAALLPDSLRDNVSARSSASEYTAQTNIKIDRGLTLSPEGLVSLDWAYIRKQLGLPPLESNSPIQTDLT